MSRIEPLKAAIRDRLAAESGGSHEWRKRHGAIYTPAHLADFVVARAISYLDPREPPQVLDPACGSGYFLVAAWRALRQQWRHGPGPVSQLAGFDIDPEAIERCRSLLALCAQVDEIELGSPPAAPTLTVSDALLEDGQQPASGSGYGLVVGNPPFVRIDRLDSDYRQALMERFGWLVGKWDLYLCFLARGLEFLAPGGVMGLVTPNQYLLGSSARGLREHLVASMRLCEILDCSGMPAFADAMPPTAISIVQNAAPAPRHPVRIGVCLSSAPGATHAVSDNQASAPLPQAEIFWGEVRQETWKEATWSVYAPEPFRRWLDGLGAPTLGDLCVRIAEGDTRRSEEGQILPAHAAPKHWWPVVRGRNLLPGQLALAAGDMADRLPPAPHAPRILVRDVAARLIASTEPRAVRCLRTVYCAYPSRGDDCQRLAGLLNADLLSWIYLRLFYSSKMSHQAANFRFQAQFLKLLPIILPPDDLPQEPLDAWTLDAYAIPGADRAEIPRVIARLSGPARKSILQP
ncbi:MAG: N-6 DNA methylase [Cyanobacteria bacterium REEB65]|nr:N-6 DNA methylase [Cyanobacteria bacterium REEB65]